MFLSRDRTLKVCSSLMPFPCLVGLDFIFRKDPKLTASTHSLLKMWMMRVIRETPVGF